MLGVDVSLIELAEMELYHHMENILSVCVYVQDFVFSFCHILCTGPWWKCRKITVVVYYWPSYAL